MPVGLPGACLATRTCAPAPGRRAFFLQDVEGCRTVIRLDLLPGKLARVADTVREEKRQGLQGVFGGPPTVARLQALQVALDRMSASGDLVGVENEVGRFSCQARVRGVDSVYGHAWGGLQ